MLQFSIIVPVYNVQNYLAACVKSVAEQAGARDWECILVDDGSTDRSAALCDAFAAEIPGVRVIHRENGGAAAARNTGLAAAEGKWILFLDGDDALAPDALPALRGALAEHPDFDWYIARHLDWQPDGSLTEHEGLAQTVGAVTGDYAARLHTLYAAARWSVWRYCLRREALLKTELRFAPDVRWAEDCLFIILLSDRMDPPYMLDIVLTHYRVGRADSLMNDTHNLPLRLASLAAAWRYAAGMAARGKLSADAYPVIRTTLADVFWPQARTAAVRDKAVRRACVPYIEQLRPLFPYGEEVRARRDWRVFQWLMRRLGARFTLWAAGLAAKRAQDAHGAA